jgi:hypothetical protein
LKVPLAARQVAIVTGAPRGASNARISQSMNTRTRGDSWRSREQGNDTDVENIVRAMRGISAASKTALNNSSRCSLSPYLLQTNSD